jgi:RNA polymerase sigma-70 factor (ECF subfamily)
MPPSEPAIEALLSRASEHDPTAVQELFTLHRQRLKHMVAMRMDSRLASRLDPSDVVQEAFAVATKKLPGYLRERPVNFYPWLRQIAWERLVELHRKHVHAERRSVRREQHQEPGLSDESMLKLVGRLPYSGSSPSRQLLDEEANARVREALAKLSEQDREVLVMLYLEQMRPQEVGQSLGLPEKTVNMRHLRALRRLRTLFSRTFPE